MFWTEEGGWSLISESCGKEFKEKVGKLVKEKVGKLFKEKNQNEKILEMGRWTSGTLGGENESGKKKSLLIEPRAICDSVFCLFHILCQVDYLSLT